MELDLSPKLAKKQYGGEGGSYSSWSPTELPMLRHGNIGASTLALNKNGLALPHYSDSSKVAYVLQGTGVAGIVLPEQDEKVVAIKKGDALALPFGVVTWWYNKDDAELVVLFLGETSKAHKAGEFTNFFLTGSNSVFRGFSHEFVGRAWDVEEPLVKALVGSQGGMGIVKVEDGFGMPEPKMADREGMALNCEEAPLDVDIKDGGRVVVLNTKNLPLVGEVGLGADLVRLDGSAMCSPGFSCDSALQVTYVVRGSGRVQVVGIDGKRVLETTLKAGNLFIVPRFFVVSKIADPEGMEWFSIISTPNPIFTHLAGRTSVGIRAERYFLMPLRGRPNARDAAMDEVNIRDDIAQLRQQMELLTQQLAAMQAHQDQQYNAESDEDEDNPFAQNLREPVVEPVENRRWEAGFKVDIPEFHGGMEADQYLDWVAAVEEIFEFKDVPISKRVQLIATRFRGRAAAWWQQLKTRSARQGKRKIEEWDKFKKHMNISFLPFNYVRYIRMAEMYAKAHSRNGLCHRFLSSYGAFPHAAPRSTERP